MKALCILSFLVWTLPVESQELKRTSFSFLNVPSYARLAALGGVNVSMADRDPNAFYSNPALVGDTLRGFASANYQFYAGDIGHASFSWLPELKRIGMFAIGIQHFNYGTIQGYDPSGNSISDFSAAESALVISRQHQIGHFRLGASIKGLFSNIAGFRSNAVAIDLGGVFLHPEMDFQAGLVIKNAGLVVSDYSSGSNSSLPIDVQAGFSLKPEHMPVRFSTTLYRLIQSEGITFSGNRPETPRTVDKVFRHFNFGAELLFHRNVNLLIGYNYGIHQELKLENAGGSAGLSLGFSAHIKTVDFVFSRSTYVAGSPAYSFSISADLKRMLNR